MVRQPTGVSLLEHRRNEEILTLSYFIYTYEIPKPLRLMYIYMYTDFAIEICGFYRRLTDTLRYHHTRCSRASGLTGIHCIRCLLIGRKVDFTRSCPLFLASFGKLRLSANYMDTS